MSGLLQSATKCIPRNHKNLQIGLYCTFTTGPKDSSRTSTQAPLSPKNVPGLSKNTVELPPGEVGPGASKNSCYKNPEYFCYHSFSYFEAEIEMKKYRLPQPSALKK